LAYKEAAAAVATFLLALLAVFTVTLILNTNVEGAQMTVTNLADIPDDWSLTYGSGPQIIFLDESVYRNGPCSIRLEPHTEADVNTARECDGTWYPVNVGDHVTASCWMKTGSATYNGANPEYYGARIGIDLYAPNNNGGISIVDSYPHDGEEHVYSMVNWGTTVWTQKTWDITIPSTFYTEDIFTETSISPAQVTQIVVWMQALPATFDEDAWFADAELYINPDYTEPPATQYFTVTASADANGTVSPSGEYSVQVNNYFTCTATPDADYVLDHWELDDVEVGSDDTYSFTGAADTAHTLTAYFTYVEPSPPEPPPSPPPAKWAINISASTGGTVTPQGTRELSVTEAINVVATANANYAFSYWLLDDENVDGTNTLTVTGTEGQQRTLLAVFQYVPPAPAEQPEPGASLMFNRIVRAGESARAPSFAEFTRRLE